jgi:predicted transcriptional regulator
MSTTTTSQSRIANTSPIASDSLSPFSNGLRFSPGSIDLLVHSRRKRAIRSQSSILTAILEACRTPNVQHWIMVKARLGYDTFWHHMNSLISQGMMETMYEGNKTLYRINAKGINYLKQLEMA